MAFKCCVSKGLLNQYIAGIAACISIVNSGTCYGWTAPILRHLLSPESEIPMTAGQASLIISIIELGNFLSPLPAGILANYVGRKPVILATGPLYILSWLMILYFPSVLILVIARVIQGFGMGLVFTVVPVYLGEIAEDSIRGAITSLFFNSWWIGFIIEYTAGPFLSFTNFTLFTMLINIPFLILFSWQPESPYFYLLTGNEEKAYKSLKFLRDASPDNLNKELEEIKCDIAAVKKSTSVCDLVATAADRKALCLFMVLTAVRNASGTGAISVFVTEIFDRTPNLSISSDTVTIIFGVVMLAGGCIGSFTTDTLGRRPILMISCVGSLICQFCAGTYYLLLFKTSIVVSTFSWIAPVLILIYSLLSTAGMYPVCSSYTSELFTSNTRGLASSFGAINVTVISFIMLASFQAVTDYIGLYANFYIYCSFILFGCLYFYNLAPETKGKSFVQIRKEL